MTAGDEQCPDPCDVQSSGDGDVLCSLCKKPTIWIKGQGFVHRRPAGDQPRRVRQLVPDGSRTGWGLPSKCKAYLSVPDQQFGRWNHLDVHCTLSQGHDGPHAAPDDVWALPPVLNHSGRHRWINSAEWGQASGDASVAAAHHAATAGHFRIRIWVGGWSDKVIDVDDPR